MGSTRRSFTPEYKAQSVAFVLDGGRPVAEVARNIGVHEMTLGKWVKLHEMPRSPGRTRMPRWASPSGPSWSACGLSPGMTKSAIAELRMQVEFAKKVATWFAKGSQ